MFFQFVLSEIEVNKMNDHSGIGYSTGANCFLQMKTGIICRELLIKAFHCQEVFMQGYDSVIKT